MNNKELGKALRQLKESPLAGNLDKGFVVKNKEILLMQIKNTSIEKKESFSIKNAWGFFESIIPDTAFRYVVRPAIMGVMIFGIVFGSWAATVSASYNSLPGDKLYSLKIMAEQAQLSLTSKDDKASLQVEFVGRRVEEIAKIAESSVKNKENRTKRAVEVINKQLNEVKTSLDDLGKNNAVEIAKLVDRKTTEFSSALEKSKEGLPADVHKDVESATSLANDTGIKALAVMIKKHSEGEIGVDTSEVKTAVEEKLKIVEDKVDQIDESIADIKENNIAENVNNTTSIQEEVSQDTKEVLVEAKKALNIEDLDGAVAKIVEAKNIVNGIIIEKVSSSSTASNESVSSTAEVSN